MSTQPVLIGGLWRTAHAAGQFSATNPRTGQPLPAAFPVSRWEDCDEALDHAMVAARQLREIDPAQIAQFLEQYATNIESRKEDLVETAHSETALPTAPRLADVELPRTTNQLRQAAAAAREGSWSLATIDTKANIRSHLAPIGPVCVFGPNNFPFAFNSVAGGDFAAAIAAGNPVIAKAHTSHPGTSQILAEEALRAAQQSDLPPTTVQMIYRLSHEDGARLVADPRLGASGYTGSREAGLTLKTSADRVGKPIYLELSSINPVVILPGALDERFETIADEFTGSCLMGSGQFCTNPGLVLLLAGEPAERLLARLAEKFNQAPIGTLLSAGVERSLEASVQRLQQAGAKVVAGGKSGGGQGFSHANTLLRVSGEEFLQRPADLQTEAFGNSSLIVVASDLAEASAVLEHLEGSLTGTIYSSAAGRDEEAYQELAPLLRRRCGRLLNDKMPTGVAVSPAMNHGGPFPATGHPGFTAVGIPAALRRFAALHCYDGVRQHRLPAALQDRNPNGQMWRLVDGRWTQDDLSPGR